MRVLVAEPSRTLAALIRATLSEAGCDIEIVADGSSAMASARTRLPDALIVDVGLPGLDGYALAHALRHLAKGQQMPTLLLAPDHAVLDHERLAYVGVSEVLTKPFERAVLLARFQGLVGLKATRASSTPLESQRPMSEDDVKPPRAEAPTLDLKQLDADIEQRVRERVAEETQRRLPSLVQAAVEQSLARTVKLELEGIVRDRLAATFERTVRSAVQELAEPARVDAIVRETLESHLQGAISKATAGVMDKVETQVSNDINTFIRNDLQKRLERQAEQIIWKVVPALAEELVKEEIKRLTES